MSDGKPRSDDVCLQEIPANQGHARHDKENKERKLNLGGHVGFDSLPDQLVNKSIGVGFCFNILCIGKFTILF